MTSSGGDVEKRKRGRPRTDASPRRAAVDQAIGATVYALLCWGFPLRSRHTKPGVAEVVGRLARDVLPGARELGLNLGPDRVEQIFEAWHAEAPSGWRGPDGLPLKGMLPKPWLTVQLEPKKPSQGAGLVDRRPNWPVGGRGASLADFARELLIHGGKWPHGAPQYLGDGALTAKPLVAARRLTPSSCDDKTG